VSLATFGAILSYALMLEGDAADFYEARARASQDSLAAALAAASRKRIDRLQRLRREGVSEMILEAIHGFEEADFPLQGRSGGGEEPWSARATAVEQTRQRFFETAAAKVPIREVSRQFERMAKENAQAVIRLRDQAAGLGG
jgi:rubrerythrin